MCKSCRAPRLDRRAFLLQLVPALVFAALPLPTARAGAAVVELPAPKPADVCPVCGTAVAQNPQWIATVLYQDGAADHFDGPRDFFKYLLDMKKVRGRADARANRAHGRDKLLRRFAHRRRERLVCAWLRRAWPKGARSWCPSRTSSMPRSLRATTVASASSVSRT